MSDVTDGGRGPWGELPPETAAVLATVAEGLRENVHEIADRMIARPGHQPDNTVPAPDTTVQVTVHPVPDTTAPLLTSAPATVTDRDAKILELHGAGLSVRAIAGQIGVSKTTVHNVIVAAGVTA